MDESLFHIQFRGGGELSIVDTHSFLGAHFAPYRDFWYALCIIR